MTTPRTRRDAVVDILHGVVVADPYRWLEAGDDDDVQRWVAEQNSLTRSALDAVPSRGTWHERLVALMGLPVVLGVQLRAGNMVLLERGAGEQQARLVARRLDDPDAAVVLADPAAGTDDAAVAIDWFEASNDGALVAYGVSEGGTENSVLRVVRVTDGSHLDEAIPNCRAASVAWEPDGSGFFYTRYPEGDEYHRTIHHHALGAPWTDDPVVWAEHPTPETWPGVELSPDGRYLLVAAMVGWSRTDQHLLDRHTAEWRTLIEGVESVQDFTFDTGGRILGTTTLDAVRGRVVAVDPSGAELGPETWHTVVPERDVVLGALRVSGDGFVLTTSRAGVDAIERWSAAGDRRTEVDDVGVSAVLGLAADRDSSTVVAIIAGFDAPPAVHRIDDATAFVVHPPAADSSVPDLTVEHVEFASADGTPIGMFLIRRADLVHDRDTPTILNGYGGFAITETPVWSPTIAAWCEAGGTYAIAQLRGGFEHGEDWHRAGRRSEKQNVFDDFHAAADWLVATGRTTRERLAIAGGSNGGLLVGAALTQRPDLCRAVWCAVPLLDMIRFPRFLIARLWTDEYGDPDVDEEFRWLYAYSPYHHVRPGERYPAVLLTTAEGDTRVDPLHARKMAAELQWAAVDQHERPVLLLQEGRAGHGAGKPVGKRAAEQADVLAFFSWQLGFDPGSDASGT